jgi:hypothetical protein
MSRDVYGSKARATPCNPNERESRDRALKADRYRKVAQCLGFGFWQSERDPRPERRLPGLIKLAVFSSFL